MWAVCRYHFYMHLFSWCLKFHLFFFSVPNFHLLEPNRSLPKLIGFNTECRLSTRPTAIESKGLTLVSEVVIKKVDYAGVIYLQTNNVKRDPKHIIISCFQPGITLLIKKLQHKYTVKANYMVAPFAQDLDEKNEDTSSHSFRTILVV
ncbi:hypothetical protein HanXRQr2_Chr10g0456971 [Helianthus annuus]|uniref:Uncharacterized protein n=1 Tax=Helianthus annuus TaxID=4232 RepID=A0A251TN26_HELAN|nr:hypothetical protein HanXRQr2_Chr10g0456971 [Helianthus annuus]